MEKSSFGLTKFQATVSRGRPRAGNCSVWIAQVISVSQICISRGRAPSIIRRTGPWPTFTAAFDDGLFGEARPRHGESDMREVIERLLQRIPGESTPELERIKRKLIEASEGGPQGIEMLFQSESETFMKEAQGLCQRLLEKIEG
jgi:hypothetical protein